MAEQKYLDFDLLIERSGERYRARVLNSPAGQAEGDFCLPFSELEVENFLLKVGRPLRQVRRVETPETEATKSFGGRLFEAVFNNEVRACFRSSLDDAERQGVGLRLRLRMTNAPELTDLPWEYLYNPSLNRFLSLAKETPIVRYLELPQRVRPIEVIPPLRVLVMISSPYNYPKLDVEREWTKLKNVLSPLEQQGLVALERLDKATLSMLQRMLRQKEYHIFHFIGHGGFDKQSQDGVLILEEDEDEGGRAVSGQYLGTLLHNHHPLRLAILNACEGGRTSRTDPFAGTAQSLVQQGIPAVIAMQFEITDEAAITFAQEFYTALTDSYPVDAALVEARTAIFAHGNNVEWGTPVLYMRSPDGQIFNIAARKQAKEQLQKTKEAVEAVQKVAQSAAPKPAVVQRLKFSKALWIGATAVAVIAIVVVLFVFKKPAPNLPDSARDGKPTTKALSDTTKISEPTPTQPTAPRSEVNQQKPAEVTTSKESGAKKKSEDAAAGGSPKERERRAEEQNAVAAKDEMLKARQSVPGSEKDKSATDKYQQAENLAAAGESQFQAGDFRAAQSSFKQARGLYVQAAEEILNILRNEADVAKKSMREAKDKIDKDSHTEDKYQQAISIETEADAAYSENDFDKAAARYKNAQELYIIVANDAAKKKEEKRRETAQREIQSLISRFKAMFESENQQVLDTSFKEVKGTWSEFFKAAEKIHVTISSKSELSQNTAQVVLSCKIDHEIKGEKQTPLEFMRIWTLEEQGNKWIIVSMKEQ